MRLNSLSGVTARRPGSYSGSPAADRLAPLFWNAYLPDIDARKEPTATPLNATLEQLKGLPDALVIVDENDVLRDEGEAYARRLSQAGVRTTTVRYNGTIHDFLLLNPLADTPAARGAIRQANDALRAVLCR